MALDLYRLPIDPNTTETMIYDRLKKHLMSQSLMIKYGYPMPDPQSPGTVVIANELYPPTPSDFSSNQRNCSRCKVTFKVNSDGTHVVKEKCYSHKGLGAYCSRCKNLKTSRGCISAEAHVVDGYGHPDYFRGFVSTTRKTTVPGVSPEVFALDCEMVCCFSTVVLY